MEFKDLLKFIKKEDKRIKKKFGKGVTQRERILFRMIKIGEEYGELCESILAFNKLQRQEKPDKANTDLAGELADVIITTLLLAESLGIDIQEALKRKMEAIDRRYLGF
jgi:NTP pyrophosphatase (non-canonical NTP hydrolase)